MWTEKTHCCNCGHEFDDADYSIEDYITDVIRQEEEKNTIEYINMVKEADND
jgi:hypothetical protein